MSILDDIEFDYGPDSDREIELKQKLVELQERYRQEAKPILDELVKFHSLKMPKMIIRGPLNKPEDVK